MSDLVSDFTTYALGRVNEATMKLKENDVEYKNADEKYTKMLSEFFNGLSEEKAIQFDELSDLMWTMAGYENVASYRLGLKDAFEIQNENFLIKKEVEE